MTATGLSERQATARREAGGANELLAQRPPGLAAIVARQLTDTMIVVLLIAAALTAVVGDVPDMIVIVAVVVLNTALGATQELRSGRALAALAELTAPHATVVRDGRVHDVQARDVVVGDLLRLSAGDIVAADACVERAESLQVDESMLTGESVPVGKSAGDIVFAGTVVTRGRADTTVTETAEATALGGIARALREGEATGTPLQRQLAVLGRWLAIAVGLAAVVVGTLNLLGGRGVETSLVLGISLAVAAIPESLPAVVSLSLAMAAQRMAARGVLARRLAAVEALGSVTVIAADKTGTLTSGRMSVANWWTPSGGSCELLEAGALCNDANPGPPGRRDDPTEVALVEAAAAAGIDVATLRAAFPRLAEIPFDAATAQMTTTHCGPDGRRRTIRKGAPEAVLRGPCDIPAAHEAAARFARAGQRVLAVAARDDGDWRLLGLIALADPPRPAAARTIDAFRRAGVRPVMITGDHRHTAEAVAAAVGIEPSAVHARVRPDEKTAVVAALRAQGEIVAMTGDGVNDAPALRSADIGVAMGERGTEVAKQAADIVLTNDDLSAMVPAIAEGRRAYDNLRRFLHYGLGGGFAEVLIMLLGPMLGFAVPLQAGQILWVNLLTHGLPGVAMGNEAALPDVLSRPPRPSREQLLDSRTARRAATLGAVIALAGLLVGTFARYADRPWQSSIFLTLAFAQLAVALALRPRRSAPNPLLLAAVAVNAVLALLAVWWLPLCDLLRTDQLAPKDVLPCVLAALVAGAVARWQSRPTTRARKDFRP